MSRVGQSGELKWVGGGGGVSLRLRHRDGGAFGVVEAVHGVELQDHVQAVGEHQDHQQAGHQTHPDPRREEPGAIAGVRELAAAAHVEALDLWGGGWSAPVSDRRGGTEVRGYLEVFKDHPPLVGRVLGCAWREEGPPVAGDRLAAVRVLGGGVDVPAAVEDGPAAVVLQLHRVQREPVAGGDLVVAPSHREAGDTHTFHQ